MPDKGESIGVGWYIEMEGTLEHSVVLKSQRHTCADKVSLARGVMAGRT